MPLTDEVTTLLLPVEHKPLKTGASAAACDKRRALGND